MNLQEDYRFAPQQDQKIEVFRVAVDNPRVQVQYILSMLSSYLNTRIYLYSDTHKTQNNLRVAVIKCSKSKIVIKWLDEQHKERTTAHSKRVEAGSKGGNATAMLKQSYSNTQALRKDKIKKDNYSDDNVLKVSDEIKKLIKK